jgi:hypothetical protein
MLIFLAITAILLTGLPLLGKYLRHIRETQTTKVDRQRGT